MDSSIDLSSYRRHFPALELEFDARRQVFFDNPGGTQVPRVVADAITQYLLTSNANTHGAFATSRRSDALIEEAHAAMADFLNARSAEEIVFGQNMTSLTFAVSRSLARGMVPGDEIVCTVLDHDANVAPWLALQEQDVTVRFVDIDPEDCTLDYDHFEGKINERTKLIAVGLASNAVGTLNDVPRVVEMARRVGALVYVDAVQAVPHIPVDVQALGCDFLACSAYKFFGPHQGILWGRRELLERLPAYKVRPSPNELPWKWETGTQSHEGQAGTLAAVEYLRGIGRDHFDRFADAVGTLTGRRAELRAGMLAIREYEHELARRFLSQIRSIPRLRLWGIGDPERIGERVPTFAVTVEGHSPEALSAGLAEHGFATWSGHYYALSLVERLGRLESGGMLRIGAAHYNTLEEVDAVVAALGEMVV
jgi:cysteine desulfurase family protein (TIGR01976 family)